MISNRFRPVLLLAAFFLLLGAKGRDDSPPDEITTIEQLGADGRGQAIAELERLAAKQSDSNLAAWAGVWAGEERRLAGDMAIARGWFEAAALEHPGHVVKDAALLGMALVDAEKNLSGNTLATLQLLDPAVAPDTMRADRLRVLARTAANEGTPGRKVRAMAEDALRWARADAVVEERVRLVLADLLPRADGSRHDAVVRLDKTTGQPLPPEQVALQIAREAMAKGDLDEVIRQSQTVAATWPDSDEARTLSLLAERASAGNPTVAGRVGVLLPLTGEYGPPAARIRDAILLANERAGRPLELVVVDTQADPAIAVKQVRELVLEKGCVALMGPLHRDAVMEAAPIAQGMGVPMIALTQSGDPAEVGEYIFRGFLSVEAQVDALVEHATTARGFTRFAILHPETAYGEQARDLFASAVAAKGGAVVRIEPYDPAGKDFRKDAQNLGQKDYVLRADEYRALKQRATSRKQDPDKVVLPPDIDFDAIFLPDNFRRSALVASSLAYEEFPIGGFRPSFAGDGVTLLGLNGWNNPDIIEAGGDVMRDAVFVDAFLATDNSPAVRDFVDAYQMAYDRSPVVLDAVAYDTARVVAAAVQAGGDDRDAIRQQLFDVRLVGPVTGAVGFAEDREVDRQLLVLTLGRSRIAPWAPPEAALPPEGVAPAPQP